MRIDLHSHSTASDGTDSPAEVVRRARDAGLDVLALTDHDSVGGIPEATAELPPDLVLIPGCELSCARVIDDRRVSVHLLAYLFDPHEPAFAAEREALRTDRERRARIIVDRLAELGAPVTWDDVTAIAGDAPIGRPHIARAMVQRGVVPDVDAAFTPDWIAHNGRAYEPKHAVDPTQGVQLVNDAGGVAVLAHPAADTRGGGLPTAAIAALADAGLAGLEVDHPDHDPASRDGLRALAGDLGLLVTGASDDHGSLTGRRLGCETTAPEMYDALVAGARGAEPIHR